MPKNKTANLFDRITSEENLYKAYAKSLEGDSKYGEEAMIFSLDEVYNLKALRESLIDRSYKFDGYIRFTVFEPKERIVDAPHYKDKVVQLAANNILKEIYNPSFIYDSYACIDGKGTHKCVDRIQNFLKRAKWEYEDAMIIKGDIKKFFYSIDRGILKLIIRKKIKCKRTLELLFKIIDSADSIDALGLPLGNTLSQLCANIYMNELDQFCKRRLSIKYYVRYMDDFIMIIDGKDAAREILKSVQAFLEQGLNIKTNDNKTKIFPINQGTNSIGFKIHATHRLLRNDSKSKIKRKVKAIPRLIAQERITVEKSECMLNGWKGHAERGNSYNFIKAIISKHDFLYIESAGERTVFKIDTTKMKEA